MKNILIALCILCGLPIFSQNGGVNIGGGTTVDNSAILQIENLNNKGVLFPQVELLDDLTNKTFPILNPINGMIVYNIGNARSHGYFFWDVDQWKLIGDSNNAVTDAVFRVTTPFNMLTGMNNQNYQIPATTNWFQFSNNISGFSGTSDGTFTLPAGNYLVSVNANIGIPTLSSNTGVAGTNLHIIKLIAKLFDGGTAIYGNPTSDNGVLRAGIHQYSTNFDFTFNLTSPAVLRFALGFDDGGTYSNAIGGTGSNDGTVTINNLSIHFQKTNILP